MHPPGFQKKEIATEPDFHEKLKRARESKKISLAEAEHTTKIRTKYITALEEGRLDLLPSSHSKGFIRQYAEFLGIPREEIQLEIARISDKTPKKQPFSVKPLEKQRQWIITPKLIGIVCLVIVLFGFIGYIAYQVKQFAAPPVLVLSKPVGESVVTSEIFPIEGKTDPGATVYIDNATINTSSDGSFSYLITLRPGLNQITIRSENRIKKQSSKAISVLYQTTATPEASPSVSPTPSTSPTGTSTPTINPSVKPSAKPTT